MKKYKIAIVGPESAGKTCLVKELAKKINCNYVPEYAREYVELLPRQYNFEDILVIAKKQKEIEDLVYLQTKRLLICDGCMLTNVVWSYDKFAKCDAWVENNMKQEHYDLFLLCKPDLPWQPDPVREDENRRYYLFDVYRKHLNEQNKKYRVVRGLGQERTNSAYKYIQSLMNKI